MPIVVPHMRNGIYRISSAARYFPELYLECQQDRSIKAVELSFASDAQKWAITPDEDGTYKISCIDDKSVLTIDATSELEVGEHELKHLWTIESRGDSSIIGNAYDDRALSLHEDNAVKTFERCNVREQRWILHFIDGDEKYSPTPGNPVVSDVPVPSSTILGSGATRPNSHDKDMNLDIFPDPKQSGKLLVDSNALLQRIYQILIDNKSFTPISPYGKTEQIQIPPDYTVHDSSTETKPSAKFPKGNLKEIDAELEIIEKNRLLKEKDEDEHQLKKLKCAVQDKEEEINTLTHNLSQEREKTQILKQLLADKDQEILDLERIHNVVKDKDEDINALIHRIRLDEDGVQFRETDMGQFLDSLAKKDQQISDLERARRSRAKEKDEDIKASMSRLGLDGDGETKSEPSRDSLANKGREMIALMNLLYTEQREMKTLTQRLVGKDQETLGVERVHRVVEEKGDKIIALIHHLRTEQAELKTLTQSLVTVDKDREALDIKRLHRVVKETDEKIQALIHGLGLGTNDVQLSDSFADKNLQNFDLENDNHELTENGHIRALMHQLDLGGDGIPVGGVELEQLLIDRLGEKEGEISTKEAELKSLTKAVGLNDTGKNEIRREDELLRLQEELNQTAISLQEVKQCHQEVEVKLQDTTNLLETRTMELRAADTYLSREDTISEAEVVQLVDDLNFEIVQASAILVDSITVSRKLIRVASVQQSTMAQAEKTVSEFLGSRGLSLYRRVGDEEKKVDFIETLFKTFLATGTRDVTKSWDFRSETSLVGLDSIYNAIYSAEAQAVAGRWRAITRHNLQRSFDPQVIDTISSALKRGLASILVFANVYITGVHAEEKVASSIGARLKIIVNLALKLNKIVGQDITSSDLEVFLVSPGQRYDKETMESAYDVEGSKTNELIVLCTTDLGLTSYVNLDQKRRVLRKPVVVLEDSLTGH